MSGPLRRYYSVAENYNVVFVLASGMITYHLLHLLSDYKIYHVLLLIPVIQA